MDDEQLARLLAGKNSPSVLEKEAGAERVIDELKQRKRVQRVAAAAGMLAAAAALWLVFLPSHQAEQVGGTLTARGGTQPSYLVRCGAATGLCRAGDTLTFEVVARAGYGFFAAFARRADGALIWYLPSDEGRAAAVPADGTVLDVGVRIAGEHTPGDYVIYGVFSREPLSRDALRDRLGPELAGRAGLSVVERSLHVAGAP